MNRVDGVTMPVPRRSTERGRVIADGESGALFSQLGTGQEPEHRLSDCYLSMPAQFSY